MFKQVVSTAVLATLAIFSGHALADSATATFQVKMTIVKSCSVTAGAPSEIDFGQVSSAAVNTTKASSINVTCSKTTPYYIGLAPTGSSTSGSGVMSSGASSDKVPYQLYSDSNLTTVWGNTATATAVGNGVTGQGSGVSKTHPIYAVVPSANFTPGSYADTVTVTVNY